MVKNHWIAGLATCPSDFPLHLWDKLAPQCEMTLNMLRGSRLNNKLSAWAQVHGQYDFDAHPIAPPGINVMVFEDADKRGSWDPHCVAGHYLGPSLEHYRNHRVWINMNNLRPVQPINCRGNESIRLANVIIDTQGPGLTVRGNCRVELTDSYVRSGEWAVRANGRTSVTVFRTYIEGARGAVGVGRQPTDGGGR